MHPLLGEIQQHVSYSALIPPALFILLALAGVLLAWRWRRFGLGLATVATLCLYTVATPPAAFLLMHTADSMADTAPTPHLDQIPGAIIVLGGDTRSTGDPEHPLVPGPITLERLYAAAQQARRLRLPVLVSGGVLGHRGDSLANLMAQALEQEFGVAVKWRESRSTNTFQNAYYSAEILRRAGIGAAYVVTNRWHMARVLWAFHYVGYPVAPLPVGKKRVHFDLLPSDFLPSMPALHESYYGLHELIGLAWYRLRYGGLSGS